MQTNIQSKQMPVAKAREYVGLSPVSGLVYQTQPPVPQGTDGATFRATSKNPPAGDYSSPPLWNPNATRAQGKGSRAGKPGPKPGRRTPNLVEENLTPKGASPTGDSPRKGLQNRALVLGHDHQPAMLCHPARARRLLSAGKAAVLRCQPFTIILKYTPKGIQPVQIKTDPGCKTTGFSITILTSHGWRVVWAMELNHRGDDIHDALLQRQQQRRARRQRNTRYRPSRFDNRTKPKGWLAPSVQSRVRRTGTWIQRLCRWTPATGISIEHVKFDTQALENPDLSGVQYQQGTLLGYEIRQYLLEKWGRKCAYCGKTDVPLEIEHIIPLIRHGSSRIKNLTIACKPCNQDKGSRTAAEYGFPELHADYRNLQAAAVTNSIRWALVQAAQTTGLPVELGSGGRTKFNRIRQGYPKAHWIDAACTGPSGQAVTLGPNLQCLKITACPRQSRRMVRPDAFGFPEGKPKGCSLVNGFRTGDLAKAVVPSGTKQGSWIGRVAVRATGSFRVGRKDGIAVRFLTKVQNTDGYYYQYSTPRAFLPALKDRVSSAPI